MSYVEIEYETRTNEKFNEGLMVTDDDGPVDLTGSSFIVHIRRSVENLEVVLEASTANGLLKLGDQEDPDELGLVEWAVPASTMAMIPPGEYPFDVLWIASGEGADNIGGGLIKLKRGITRP